MTHHYAFVHIFLRNAAFAYREKIFDILISEKHAQFFDHLLQEVDALVGPIQAKGENGRPLDFSGVDIKVHGYDLFGRPCALVEMPIPRLPGEAFFVAVVSRLPFSQLESVVEEHTFVPLIDYYTLERTFDGLTPETTPDREIWSEFSAGKLNARSAFCGWSLVDDNRFGGHINYGRNDIIPSVDSFIGFLAYWEEAKAKNEGDSSKPQASKPRADYDYLETFF